MNLGTTVSFLGLQIAQPGELIRAFGRWWLREFLHLFPKRLAGWLVDSGGRKLVLAPEADVVALHLKADQGHLLGSRRVGRADYLPSQVDEFLSYHRCNRAQVSVGLSLPQEQIFCRSFALPLETRRMLEAVIVQDLLAKTPFQLEDIHHGHSVRREGERLVVFQCVVRRAHVSAAAETLGLDPDEIGFVETLNASGDETPPTIITKQSSPLNRNRWVQMITLGLAGTALLLATMVLTLRYQRQQAVLDGLQSEIAAATAKAKGVLSAIDKLQQEQAVTQRIRALRNEPGLVDLWEETTRILPAHTWLSELRLSEAPDGRQVVMSGFSTAAASLVRLLDGSQVFAEAALVGPITVDPTEGKERFIIQAKLKPPASSKTASQ